MEMADRHSIDMWKLWYVAMLDNQQDQVELLQQVIQMNLTVKQIKDLIEKGSDVTTNSDEDDQLFRLPKAALQIAKLALKPDSQMDAQRLAEAFVNLERDKRVAKVRIKALRELLEEAESYIDGV